MQKEYTFDGAERVIFALPGLEGVQSAMCEIPGSVPGEIKQRSFPNGEIHRSLGTSPDYRGKEVWLVGSTDDRDFLAFLDFARELASEVDTLHLVVPFFRYSTQERRKERGEIVTARNRAEMISDLPAAKGGSHIHLFDIHAPVIGEFFNPDRITVHQHLCRDVIEKAISKHIQGDLVIGSADGGRTTWICALAERLGVPAAFIEKERLSGSETRTIGEVDGDVRGKVVVMYDDMIRSGSTAIGAAVKYREAGAKEVWLVATHGDFTPDAVERCESSGVIHGIIVTDSWRNAALYRGDFVKVLPIGGFVADRVLEVSLSCNLNQELECDPRQPMVEYPVQYPIAP